MVKYIFNTNVDRNGYHEVHTENCVHRPAFYNTAVIGYHNTCREAISAVRRQYPAKKFDGCGHCCSSCHKY